MKAIIFAAGRSSRLEDLTENLPKSCLEIADGQTMLQRTLSFIQEAGIEEVKIITGHASINIEKEVINWQEKFSSIKTIYNPLFIERNNIYTAYLIRELITSDTLIFNSDLVFDKKILDIAVTALNEKDNSFLMVDDQKELVDEDMKILLNDVGNIIRINKNLINENCTGEYIGILRLAKTDIDIFKDSLETMIEREDFDKYYEDAIDERLEDMNISFVSTKGLAWSEIDTKVDYQKAQEKFSLLKQ